MPKFICEVIEEVLVSIRIEVDADTAEKAGKIARHQWVTNGEGLKSEQVNGRWVEVNGDTVATSEEDE